jgi:uncharacterized protein YjbI with pentapeptide repeats
MAEEPGQEKTDAPSNEDNPSRGRLIAFGIVGAILVVVILWVWVNPSDPTEKKDFIQAVGVLIAGLAGFVGLYFTWTNLNQTRQTTQRTLELTEQGQITERFTRAIDQLGATDDAGKPRLEVRLGGIYALERIDKESPERAYHSTVMEVLTAYVRENSRWEPEESSTSTTASTEDVEQDKGVAQDVQPTLRRLPIDIRAILDILKRREEESVSEEHRVLLDLREASLQGADLQEADLLQADLLQADLRGADLRGAYLQEASLQEASLQEASLQGAYLQGAYLHGASLQGADLQGADLARAYFNGAYLMGADIQGANLQRATLVRADLAEANLAEASLNGAYLMGADIQEADLGGAILRGANLQGAILRGARNLNQDQIEEATGSNETELPEDLKRPELWNESIEKQEKILRKRIFGSD